MIYLLFGTSRSFVAGMTDLAHLSGSSSSDHPLLKRVQVMFEANGSEERL